MEKVKLILIGAGQRGAGAYASYALDNTNDVEFVGVADPDKKRRDEFVLNHKIKEENVFSSWEDVFKRDKFADGIILATQDKMHYEPALKAMECGYHVLCEKPMSPNAKECLEMGNASKKYNKILSICHVLRYTPFFTQVKEVLDRGDIGDIMCIQWIEQVAYWHQAHSFVRGNWRKAEDGSPMIMAKSCHDMDMILWLMGKKCKSVSSYGKLTHFTKENAPKGATERCLDGCAVKHECPYYAPKIYIDWKDVWQAAILRKVVSVDTSTEALMKELKTGPYGRCVYHCDNDVVDNQVVNMNFEGGATVSFVMTAFTMEGGRLIKIMGTKGELYGNADENEFTYVDYLTKTKKMVKVHPEGGHMGGDSGIMRDFIRQVASNGKDVGRTSANESVDSHLLTLASEESRVSGKTIDMDDYIKRLIV